METKFYKVDWQCDQCGTHKQAASVSNFKDARRKLMDMGWYENAELPRCLCPECREVIYDNR